MRWLLFVAACSSAEPPLRTVTEDPTDVPLVGANADERALFKQGDVRFDAVFRDPDGLGPLYIRTACSACHEAAAKGPGNVQKMALVDSDGVTPLADQSQLQWGHTVRPYTAGGGRTPISPPSLPNLLMSSRMGVPVFGRGYVEAIDDAEILRVEAEQATRSDSIHGVANRVIYPSQPNP